MLVLSRRPNEKIVFPSIGITVEVFRIQGNVVRLGIEAPPSVPVYRGEIASSLKEMNAFDMKSNRHQFRNRLHTASLALHLAKAITGRLNTGGRTESCRGHRRVFVPK